MERLNSRLQKLKSKKGFTLIELLAVIAIIAVLVLIAAPSFLGSKEKATLAAVKADIKTAELAIGRHLLEHETLAKQTVNGKEVGFDKYTPESGKDYYSNKGKLDTPVGGELYDISKIIDSKVLDKGDLVASDNGKVYFVTDEGKLKNPGKGNSSAGENNSGNGSGTGTENETGNGSNPGSGGEKEPEVNLKPNDEKDFEWVYDKNGYNATGNKYAGYWHYKGTSKEVVIPEQINNETLTNYYSMFEGTSVTKVTSTNKKVTSMNSMFKNSKASSLDLSNLDTSNVTNMGRMFKWSKIKELDLSSFNTSEVADMSEMFYEAYATPLDLSSFDTRKVTNMSTMFYSTDTTTINFGKNFNTSNVKNMHHMFLHANATSLDLSKFDTRKVTDMGGMFGWSKIKELDLSSFDTSSVTTYYSTNAMFEQAETTIVYAKTEEDAKRFNDSSKKPSGLTSKVK